jgi:tetratricopeptide (TPR) repeat protein
MTAIVVNRICYLATTDGNIVYSFKHIAVMKKYRRVVIMMPALYLISLVAGNLFYMPSWQNDYTLLKKICDRDNANFRGMAAFACLELSNKNFSEALEVADRMREETWMTKSQKNAIKLFKEFVRGMIFYNSGDNNAAMTCFSQLLVPEMPILNRLVRGVPAMTFYTIANIYLERGEKTHAAEFFLKLSEIIDDNTAKYFYSGLSAYLNGNLESAKINFSHALEISPNDDKSKANLLIVEKMLKEKLNY